MGNGEVHYSRSGDYAEIILRDETGRKMDTLKWPRANAKMGAKIKRILQDKYGYSFDPTIPDEKDGDHNGFFTTEPKDFDWGFDK